jgi:microsomal prostaglandin-E synthase 2
MYYITMSRFARISHSAAFATSSAANLTSASQAPRFNYRRFLTTPPARLFTAATSIQPEVTLFQYQICPFCNITKSLLSHSKLDFECVEVNPLTKAELKAWSGEYRKVPIAVIDGNQINGSEKIIETILTEPFVQKMLQERWADEKCNDMTMQQFQTSDNAQKWLRFAVDDLAALLYPNICGSLSDSHEAFGYVRNVDSFSALQKISVQSLGALAMYFAAKKVKCESLITAWKVSLNSHSLCALLLQQSETLRMKR